MFEKNSDLYFEETASCSAFSSTRRLASSTSSFLRSTSMFCSARRLACLPRSSLELLSCSWRACRSCAWDWDCLSRFSVRVLASIVFSTSPMLSISWSRNAWWVALKGLKEASSTTALTDHALAEAEVIRNVLTLLVAVSGLIDEHRLATLFEAGHRVEDAMLRRYERRELGEDHARDSGQVALALEHAREALEVGLQPVLLGVLARRIAQVADHLVELVLQHG